MTVERELPPPRILLDDREVARVHSMLVHLGGHQLTILTVLPDLGVELQTSILGHRHSETVITNLACGPGIAETATHTLPAGALEGTVARAARVLEHYAHLQTLLERLGTDGVRIDVDDAALHGYVESST